MAVNRKEYNKGSVAGSEQNNCLIQLAAAWDRYRHLRNGQIQRKVNGASGDAVFVQIATDYGYADSTVANAAFTQIDSAFTTGDAAITQMLDMLL